MKYIEYINLGFERIDLNDQVEHDNTGYSGYVLCRKITPKINIEVCFGELQRPKMYIKKKDSETYHIIVISPEIVKSLCV